MSNGNVVLAGGRMTVDQERGATVIRWPNPAGMMRYVIAAFLIFWLCGWATGEVTVAHQLLAGKRSSVDLFSTAWLAMWTIGGACAVCFLFMILRPSRPATLTLDADRLIYDPGFDPAAFMESLNRNSRRAATRNAFLDFARAMPKKPVSFMRSEAGAVRLDWIGERQRLTIDHGANRHEIGTSLAEPEKEWLATRLEQWRVGV